MSRTALSRPLRRALAMDRAELQFRLRLGARRVLERGQFAIAPPRWRRERFAPLLRPDAQSSALTASRAAASRRDWGAAHRALAAHIAGRQSSFPLPAAHVETVADRVRRRFPDAAAEAARRADRMAAGRYDVLGYRDVEFGAPPRWDFDPVHGRRAPGGHWASLAYLDPASGDHKIIWEINRHQHFLGLGRAFHLTGDRRYYEAFVTQLEDWLRVNPPLQGVNWASMLEAALRTLSWLWALEFFAGAALTDPDGAPPWTVDVIVALDRHLEHIARNLSRYFSPNTHLTGEALALYVGGLCLPELCASARRAAIGGDVLVTEAARQVLGDGGHAERSAHYHRYSTDFYLFAFAVGRQAGDTRHPALRATARRQAEFLRILADDQGRLPLLGDDDGGQLLPICGRSPADCRDTLASAAILLEAAGLNPGGVPEETFWLCGSRAPIEAQTGSASPPSSAGLRESGYYVMRDGAGGHLVFDAGAHGFLNGGHAHADALSVALTHGGAPLLVDPGTATYTMDAQLRDRFRSTAMHNTVVVNGRSQSEPAGPFHWRTRTDGVASIWQATSRFDYAEGRHDGYSSVVHTRSVIAVHGLGWLIVDHLLGHVTAAAEAFWHVHPSWAVSVDGRVAHLKHSTGRCAVLASSARVERATDLLDLYAPEYGRIERAPALRARITGLLPRSLATFVPAEAHATDVAVSPLSVRLPPPAGWHAAAFHISWSGREADLLCAVEQNGRPSHPDASPGAPWGTAGVLTNARVVFTGDLEAIAINGTVVASSVHRAGGARVRAS